jgi:hypothetical protein
LKITLPVGVPASLDTFAVNVTDSPKVDGFRDETTCVVVAGLITVNDCVAEVPPPGALFVTDTFRGPVAAVEAMVMLAVIWVALSTEVVFTVMSEPKFTELTPLMKFVPEKTTFRVCVRLPLAGAIVVSVGRGLLIVNDALVAPVRLLLVALRV